MFKLPVLMLGLLLFNAGVGVEINSLKSVRNYPLPLIIGLIANLIVPIGFIGGVMFIMNLWHNPDEVQNILVGLALVASMPIAGSSAAWSQNANGNLALSLGLVLGSTFLSPITTPLALHSVGAMTTGDYSADLHQLAGSGTGLFLLISVITPSLLGICTHQLVGKERVTASKEHLKVANSMILLLLNYSNAAVSLPQALAKPDFDFLAVTLSITIMLCIVSFSAGWAISRVGKSNPEDTTALMFGLGMNNNGTGLVLASMVLADHPQVLLPIIFYNLVQHLVASLVDKFALGVLNDRHTERTVESPAWLVATTFKSAELAWGHGVMWSRSTSDDHLLCSAQNEYAARIQWHLEHSVVCLSGVEDFNDINQLDSVPAERVD